MNDAELLRRFAREGDQDAFAEVVRRHAGLVYAAARRQTGGNVHLAQDVTQAVFITLAKKAAWAAKQRVLVAWLYRCTRLAALQARRNEARRVAREDAAARAAEVDAGVVGDAEWTEVEPVLDEAMERLSERDREAVLLRFFAGRSFAEIGAALGVGENAARMRTERALEKLRGALARKGVTSTASALGGVLTSHAAPVAPVGVISSVVAAGMTTPAVIGAGGAAYVAATFMKWKIGVVMAGVAFFVGGAGGWFARGWRGNDEAKVVARVEVRREAENPVAARSEAGNMARVDRARKREMEDLKRRLNVSEKWLKRTFDEIDARNRAGGGSAFRNIVEAAQFTANLRRKQREFATAYPTLPAEGTEARREYDEGLDNLSRDMLLALMDPLYAQEMKSGDPERVAALQAAFACARSGLSDDRIATMTPVVQEAFKELQRLYPDPLGATNEDPRVREIEERLNARLKALLTPEEWQALKENGCSQMLYVFYGNAI